MSNGTASSRSSSPGVRPVASGIGWRAIEFVCTSGPGDRPFEERHEQVTIAGVLDGSFTYRTENSRAMLHSGAILLGNAGACYECGHDHGRGDRCVAVHFGTEFFNEIAAGVSGTSSFRFPTSSIRARPAITALWSGLDAAGSSKMVRDIAIIQLAEFAISAVGDGKLRSDQISSKDERRVSRSLRFIEAQLSEELSLDAIARVAQTSKYHFLRIFRQHVGTTPYRYALDLRLRRAAVALATSSEPVSGIALDCGFGDLSTFNRQFRAEFGLSPQRYRLQEGQRTAQMPLRSPSQGARQSRKALARPRRVWA